MPANVWRIGYVAARVNRKTNTIHKWEHAGVIAPSMDRGGEVVGHRVYTKGEVLLIVKAHKLWWREHHELHTGFSNPKIFRFGQIYWDLRKFLVPSPTISHDYILEIPEGYHVVDRLSFDPNKVYYREGKTLMRLISETNAAIRDSSLKKVRRSLQTRLEFLSHVFQAKTVVEMGKIIEKYEELVKCQDQLVSQLAAQQ